MSRGNVKACLRARYELEWRWLSAFRHCERSKAIQSLSAAAVWIASLRRNDGAETVHPNITSRAPDAAQRFPGDAKHRPVQRCAAEPGPMQQRVAALRHTKASPLHNCHSL
ncbi:hypothetical protein GCM10007858_35510 [Bradyrhizobium liaoningense]|nr:hypothetical protein GCM10007858_35510 [Bradyrhizobium liaoningense]